MPKPTELVSTANMDAGGDGSNSDTASSAKKENRIDPTNEENEKEGDPVKISEEEQDTSDIIDREISDDEDEKSVNSDEPCPNCGHDRGDGTELWWDDGSGEYDDLEKRDDDCWYGKTGNGDKDSA